MGAAGVCCYLQMERDMSTSSEVLMSVSGLQESVAGSPSLVKLTGVSLQLNSSNSTSSDFLVYIYSSSWKYWHRHNHLAGLQATPLAEARWFRTISVLWGTDDSSVRGLTRGVTQKEVYVHSNTLPVTVTRHKLPYSLLYFYHKHYNILTHFKPHPLHKNKILCAEKKRKEVRSAAAAEKNLLLVSAAAGEQSSGELRAQRGDAQ